MHLSIFLGKRFHATIVVGMLLSFLGGLIIVYLPDLINEYRQGSVAHPRYVTDLSDDRKLIGVTDSVFFGKVVEQSGHFNDGELPETHFTVTALEVLKGTIEPYKEVTLTQLGGTQKSGSEFRMADVPHLLEPGEIYLFVTNTRIEENWHAVSTKYSHIKIESPGLNVSDDELLKSKQAALLRVRFKDAVENEITFNPNNQ